jgi:hypothetical protein
MDDFTQRVFLGELQRQCTFALRAFAAIEVCAKHGLGEELFYHVQGFLIATANVSKILYPDQHAKQPALRAACQKRGRDLRALLGVQASSVFERREARNHFEHFDERVQEWAERGSGRNFIDGNILVQTPVAQAFPGAHPRDIFRLYSTPPPAVWFWSQEYPLQPFVDAMVALLREIDARDGEW